MCLDRGYCYVTFERSCICEIFYERRVILNTAPREGKITHLKQLRFNPQKYTESAASVHIPPPLPLEHI